jgi:hypothetical protein
VQHAAGLIGEDPARFLSPDELAALAGRGDPAHLYP